MRTCNACGGLIGKDCFNPQECEEIAMAQMYQDLEHKEAIEHIKNCEQCQKELSL